MRFKLHIRGRDDSQSSTPAKVANLRIETLPIRGNAEFAANDSQKSAPAPEPISGLAELATYYERPDPLVWLRQFIGTDTVPVTAVRHAAHDADIPWLSVISLKDDWLIEQKSMDQIYWKFPKHDWTRP